ncbi:MAG: hypothetical protein ACK559_31790, partial [bacterium]
MPGPGARPARPPLRRERPSPTLDREQGLEPGGGRKQVGIAMRRADQLHAQRQPLRLEQRQGQRRR